MKTQTVPRCDYEEGGRVTIDSISGRRNERDPESVHTPVRPWPPLGIHVTDYGVQELRSNDPLRASALRTQRPKQASYRRLKRRRVHIPCETLQHSRDFGGPALKLYVASSDFECTFE